jgi:hypothetical protein
MSNTSTLQISMAYKLQVHYAISSNQQYNHNKMSENQTTSKVQNAHAGEQNQNNKSGNIQIPPLKTDKEGKPSENKLQDTDEKTGIDKMQYRNDGNRNMTNAEGNWSRENKNKEDRSL